MKDTPRTIQLTLDNLIWILKSTFVFSLYIHICLFLYVRKDFFRIDDFSHSLHYIQNISIFKL
jgi:hypothetical protein